MRIHENDREGLERLCRCAVRPPALERLSLGEEGQIVYRMERPRNEALYLRLTPDELLARIATRVTPHGPTHSGTTVLEARSAHSGRTVFLGRFTQSSLYRTPTLGVTSPQ